MALDKSEVKRLKGLAHHLKPVALAGKSGLTEMFITSVDQALTKRELIKVKFLENSELDTKEDGQLLANKLDANLIGTIGFTLILYRFNEELSTHA